MGLTTSTENKLELLTSAISAIIGLELQSSATPEENPRKICLFNYHDKTYSYGSVGVADATRIEDETNKITIFVKTLTGQTIICSINSSNAVGDLKLVIKENANIPANKQRIIFAGRQLNDEQLLCDCNIQNECTVHLVLLLGDDNESCTILDPSSMDPVHDYDFRNIKDQNRNFIRGGIKYIRPCGWQRFAIKVSGRFENMTWLRCSNDPGEWPVSYHGTGQYDGKTIAMQGSELTNGKDFPFRYGVYTTPDIKVAEKYAIKFTYNGSDYLVVLQNRVNPETLQRIPADEQTDIGEYWINPSDKDVRPYGICIRKV